MFVYTIIRIRSALIILFLILFFSAYGQNQRVQEGILFSNKKTDFGNTQTARIDSLRKAFKKRTAFKDSVRRVIELKDLDQQKADRIRQAILKKENNSIKEQETRKEIFSNDFKESFFRMVRDKKFNYRKLNNKTSNLYNSIDPLIEIHTKKRLNRKKAFLTEESREEGNFPAIRVLGNSNDSNDYFKNAYSISIGDSIIDLSIDPAGDVDVYKFYGIAEDNIEIKISARSIGSSLDSYIYLYGSDTTSCLVENDDNSINNPDSKIVYKLNYSDFYYILVREFNHPYKGGDNYYYTLTVKSVSPPAAISGTVYENDGSTPITNTRIRVYDKDWSYSGEDYTDSNGKFVINGLVKNSYYVCADGYVFGQGYVYIKEHYNNASERENAVAVTVTAPDTTRSIDFTLERGGAISGTVYEIDGTTTIEDTWIEIFDSDWNYVRGVYSDSSGQYTIGGLRSGLYYVYADGFVFNQGDIYVEEFYNDGSKSAVSVSAPAIISDIDFTLEHGGSISGSIFESDGVTVIENAWVEIYDSSWHYVKGTSSDSNGRYTIGGIRSGLYYVYANGWVNDNEHIYFEEYYKDSHNREGAVSVSVTAFNNTNNIDFTLDRSGAISGTVYESDGLTPIANTMVWAECSGYLKGAYTDSEGRYVIGPLSSNMYLVYADGWVNNKGYVYCKEYYYNVPDSSSAVYVSVNVPDTTKGIDFTLEYGGAISGVVYRKDGLHLSPMLVLLSLILIGIM